MPSWSWLVVAVARSGLWVLAYLPLNRDNLGNTDMGPTMHNCGPLCTLHIGRATQSYSQLCTTVHCYYALHIVTIMHSTEMRPIAC